MPVHQLPVVRLIVLEGSRERTLPVKRQLALPVSLVVVPLTLVQVAVQVVVLARTVPLTLHVHSTVIDFTCWILNLSRTGLNDPIIEQSLYDDGVGSGRYLEYALALDMIIHKLSLVNSSILEYHDACAVLHVPAERALVYIAVRIDQPARPIFHAVLECALELGSVYPRIHLVFSYCNEITKALHPLNSLHSLVRAHALLQVSFSGVKLDTARE